MSTADNPASGEFGGSFRFRLLIMPCFAPFLILIAASVGFAQSAIGTDEGEEPNPTTRRLTWTPEDWLYSPDGSMRPGLVDLRYRTIPGADHLNALFWSPVFRGGVGYIKPDGGHRTVFWGGYVRPFAWKPEYGELVVGGEALSIQGKIDFGLQAEY